LLHKHPNIAKQNTLLVKYKIKNILKTINRTKETHMPTSGSKWVDVV